MGTILDVCDLRGPPRTTLRTPKGSMDPWLRTYALSGRSKCSSQTTFFKQALEQGSQTGDEDQNEKIYKNDHIVF
jgi:hypothetical protein